MVINTALRETRLGEGRLGRALDNKRHVTENPPAARSFHLRLRYTDTHAIAGHETWTRTRTHQRRTPSPRRDAVLCARCVAPTRGGVLCQLLAPAHVIERGYVGGKSKSKKRVEEVTAVKAESAAPTRIDQQHDRGMHNNFFHHY